jgi:Transposase
MKAAVATLLRTSWNTVDGLVRRLVAAHLDPRVASHRLARLARIGVDEIAYRKGRKFLTIVNDHDTGHVVWVREGRTQAALIALLDTLGPGPEQIRAISMDMTRIYREAARIHLPQAAICYDPVSPDQVGWGSPRPGPSGRARRRRPDPGRWAVGGQDLAEGPHDPPRSGRESRPHRQSDHQPTAHQAETAVPRLAAQGEPAWPLSRTDREDRRAAPGQVVPRGCPLQHQRLHDPEPTNPSPLRRHHRRHQPPTIQLPYRGHQRRHPAHPTPRQRLRQPRQPHRNDPRLPWRHPCPAANHP